MVVYCITNKINGKKYIGQTSNFDKRISGHKKKTSCVALWRAIQKYGWENFDKKVLVETSKEEVDDLERKIIKKYNTLIPNGYNIRIGGEANNIHHPSSVHKMKQTMPNRKPISIKGVVYNSVREAARVIGESHQMIIYRLKSPTYTDWVYFDEKGYYDEKQQEKVNVNDKSINPNHSYWEVDGKIYNSQRQAGEAYGITKTGAQHRFKSEKHKGWKKLSYQRKVL